MGRRRLSPEEKAARDAQVAERDARRTAHLGRRLNAARGTFWTVSTALPSRLGLFAPVIKRVRGEDWGRTGVPTETDFGTVSVTGRVGQLHQAFLEALFWRMTGQPQEQDDGTVLVSAPLGALCRDLSTISKASTQTPLRLVQELSEATFSVDLRRKYPWRPPAGVSSHLFGPFVARHAVRILELDDLEHPIIVKGEDGEEPTVLAASKSILDVWLGKDFFTLLKYDRIQLKGCRLPLLQIHSAPLQAAVRWILAQTRKGNRQPAGGGWYHLRNAVQKLCGDRPVRWMDQQITAARKISADVWASLGLEASTGRVSKDKQQGGGAVRSDVLIRFTQESLIWDEDDEDDE